MKLEVLATPQQGLTKDDLLGAAVSAVHTVEKCSARQYRSGLVSIVLVADVRDEVAFVAAVRREVARMSTTAPEVTVR